MLKINQIRCEVGETFSVHHIAKKLRCSIHDIHSFEIDRESIDARGDDLHYSYSVYASITNEDKYLKKYMFFQQPQRLQVKGPSS